MALERFAFPPFALVIDEWRWKVFSGEVTPSGYNKAWWDLRLKYQGVAPSATRGEELFDPGAKYHVPDNTPYMRYFLARILQFQFDRALSRRVHGSPLPVLHFREQGGGPAPECDAGHGHVEAVARRAQGPDRLAADGRDRHPRLFRAAVDVARPAARRETHRVVAESVAAGFSPPLNVRLKADATATSAA